MKTLNELAEEYRQSFKDAKISNLTIFPIYGEAKWDGEFVVIFSDGKSVKIANRHKTVYDPTSNELLGLPKGVYVAIAEHISLRGDLYCYLSDRAKPNCETLALRIHSIVYLGNTDCQNMDYETRRRMLEQLFVRQTEYVQLVSHKKVNSQAEATAYYDECRAQGREGLVLKPLGTLKESGYKVKSKVTIDCAVLGIKKSKKWVEKKIPNSFVLGVMEKGKWKRFGESSSGLTDAERREIGKSTLANKTGEDVHYIYCKPSVVLEICCQSIEKNGFRHPRIIRIRGDKSVTMVTPKPQIDDLVDKVLDSYFPCTRNGKT